MELRRAIYEDTNFVGWWLEKENPTVRMSSTQYRVTLPLNNKYIITFIDPRNDKWKIIYIEPGDVFKANSQFTVTADFNTTDGLSILYNYATKMFMFRTLERYSLRGNSGKL
jgi:hypothetical protein